MPKISIPESHRVKLVLKPQHWYLLHDPSPRLILCLGELPISTRPPSGGMMIYDPGKNSIENVPEEKIVPAQEVEVEIHVI